MAYTQRQYEIASRRTGVPIQLLKLVVGRESGGKHNAVSPAGAHGEMQLMPGTARGLERKYKINTRTPMGNLLGGAYYLSDQKRTFGNWRLALAAYNAGPNAVKQYDGVPPYRETQAYVEHIMGQFHGGPTGPRAPARNTPGAPLSTPSFDPKAFALSSSQDIAAGQYDPIQELQSLHEAMLAASQAGKSGAGTTSATTGAPQISHMPAQTGDWQKFVKLAQGADRPGVTTDPSVLQFVGQIGMRFGRRLTIGTGTQHNQYVVGTHRESDHWTGHAADIPMSGAALTRLGRAALVAAGMSPKKARKIKGGVFNIGGYQILFNTNEGGNHYNHLHVGIH
jgi:hypothetical protein